ncbi:MAG: chromosome segregation protein SMC [Betaproteobacteria bacterium]|nr:chromosome segregation protein SMC [Betaproteobacteria bacterium]
MRLTHLKLTGFKSFVDSTTLHIHGQRVGVVGPNGCGKSNVMESVRWVLGEASAKEMRADAMDAVIFNGSAHRNPISRASVELVFDNSLGGASGAWSQYAEISVKRVIERDKGSTYYINNAVVRRRDVTDLFLGTGLGGRAYAIIGQNTISRIVEAKPEEMRIFLEEAAGVSKYKERRRETELRLRDTRENLTRVEDILQELDKQIVRLQAQSVIAEQYYRLQESLHLIKGLVWLVKRRDAGVQWERAQRGVENLVIELEAQMANLRSSEYALEVARQQHLASTEAVNQAQSAYYEANATVSNLENQFKNTTEARERMQQQLQQLFTQRDKNADQQGDVQNLISLAEANLQAASAALEVAQEDVLSAQASVPMQLDHYQSALAAFNASQSSWLNAEHRLRIEQANISHLNRAVAETKEQLRRFQESLAGLQVPSDGMLQQKRDELLHHEAEVERLETEHANRLKQEQQLHAEIRTLREILQQTQREQHVIEAEIVSLQKIQQAMRESNHEVGFADWLKAAGLTESARIWEMVRIKPGWETAFEVTLGARLNAIVLKEMTAVRQFQDRPSVALSLAWGGGVGDFSVAGSTEFTPLDTMIERAESAQQTILQDWLSGVYLLEEGVNALEASERLQSGECLVNQQGDIFTRHSVTYYYAAQTVMHGVLERQSRLEALQAELPSVQQRLAGEARNLAQLESNLQALHSGQHAHQQSLKSATQQVHQLSLSLQQLQQQQSNALQQEKVLLTDTTLAEEKLGRLHEEGVLKTKLVSEIAESLAGLQQERIDAELSKQLAESALNEARQHQQHIEKQHQEMSFNVKLIINNINELSKRFEFLHEEMASLSLRAAELEATLAATKMETLKTHLQAALDEKHTRESVLAQARNAMSECESTLLQHERARLQNEQSLHPLRDRLESGRLNEQEARLIFEQCQSGLSVAGIEEAVLETHLKQSLGGAPKMIDLQKHQDQLELNIEALGAVNLAAIEELTTEQARKYYLDSQCLDLKEASETLEDAIRKIDRETRGRLQTTFDEANQHFNDLFTTLFGGGQARLELLGDEILDMGMQVFAQPPGKKNSTIHLLSGGEKALTALALVFALFRLNPAPFCLMDEVDAPLDDSNTERFCAMVKKMSEKTQFLYVSHNKITMEMAQQLIGVTMQESGVSRIVDVDIEAAIKMAEAA